MVGTAEAESAVGGLIVLGKSLSRKKRAGEIQPSLYFSADFQLGRLRGVSQRPHLVMRTLNARRLAAHNLSQIR